MWRAGRRPAPRRPVGVFGASKANPAAERRMRVQAVRPLDVAVAERAICAPGIV